MPCGRSGGTQKQSFHRLWQQLQPVLSSGDWIIQAGHNSWSSERSNVQVIDFVEQEQLQHWIEEADLIITHAGAGSMLQALYYHKRIIAIPRLAKYGEHVNDHQLELALKFEHLGYLKVLTEADSLSSLLPLMDEFHPLPYQSQNDLVPLLHQKLTQLLS